MSLIYTVLFDIIDEHRECAGVHDAEGRRAFVERFLEWSEQSRRYLPTVLCERNIRDWAEEVYSDAIDTRTHIGRRVMAGLLGELEDNRAAVMRGLIAAIQDVAEDVAEERAEASEAVEVTDDGEYQSGTE